jgi:Leucine-rich repeat (LRR) protein
MSRKCFLGLSHYLVLAIVLASLLTLLIPVSVVNGDSVVTFPDPNLEAAIREAVGKPTGDIYQSDLDGLSTLIARDRAIANLAGLEHCTNLISLQLFDNEISDISPVAGLTSLTGLYLTGNEISDIAAVSGLTNLIVLEVDGNQISNISPLSGLAELDFLTLSQNQISDLSPLSGLTKLDQVYLGSNQISDLSPLSGLTSVRVLGLDGNQISNLLSSLSGLNNLTELGLSTNQISNLSSLSGLNNLTSLSLYRNQISDLSPLSGRTGLTGLNLGENQISDLSPLSALTGLTNLSLFSNQISDIQPLVNNTGIASGDTVTLWTNPLNINSINTCIPALQGRGVTVYWDTPANQSPSQPSNVSPATGATVVSLTPTLQASVFSDSDTGDTHIASQWQISATADNYSSPVFDSSTDSSHLTSIIASSLNWSTTYYWHVRYEDNHGAWSSWSSETSITTATDPSSNLPPSQPSNVSPATGATVVSLTPTLQASVFSDSDTGDTHIASQWQISATADNYSSPVFDSSTDSSHLTSIIASSLNWSTTYYWHVRYEDNHGAWSSWSSETSITTATDPSSNLPPSQPSNVSPAAGATVVSLTPTLQASVFSDSDTGDTHIASQWQISTTAGNYSGPVFDSSTDTSHLTSISTASLNWSTRYYWHVRYEDNHGAWSSWSSETSFATAAAAGSERPPSQPSNVFPQTGVTGGESDTNAAGISLL